MDFDALTITFSVNNAAVVEISGEPGFRRCINNQTLTRKTTVTVYRGDEPGVAMPAGQIPELTALFDEILGGPIGGKSAAPAKPEPEAKPPAAAPETATDPEPEPTSETKPEAPPPPPSTEVTAVPTSTPPSITPPPPRAGQSPEPPAAAPPPAQRTPEPLARSEPRAGPPPQPKARSGAGCLVWLVILTVVAAAFWWAAHRPNDNAFDPPVPYRVAAGKNRVNVRVAPDPESEQADRPLTQGETVLALERLFYDDTTNGLKTPWLKIRFRGDKTGYVRESLLEEASNASDAAADPKPSPPSATGSTHRAPSPSRETARPEPRPEPVATARGSVDQPSADSSSAPRADPVAARPPPASPQPLPPITRPAWQRRATAAQFLAVTPKEILREAVFIQAVMDCQVDAAGALGDCRLMSETPADRGLAAAARRLLPDYRMEPLDRDGQPTAGRRYTLTMQLNSAPTN